MGPLRRKLYRPHLGTRRPAADHPKTREGLTEVPQNIVRYIDDGNPSIAPAGTTFAEALAFSQGNTDRMSMTLIPRSTPNVIGKLAEVWDLHPLLVEDLIKGSQRPKIERYHNVLFIVARSAWYVDDTEQVEFAEFHILLRPGAVVVLCQDGRWIDGTDVDSFNLDRNSDRKRLDGNLMSDTELLRLGPEAVVYKLLDGIIDGYVPVLEGLDIDKDQIERQVFSGDATATERIYRLSQEVIDLKQACASLTGVVTMLGLGFKRFGISADLQTYFGDLGDHLARINTEVMELRDSLTQILNVNATLVGQRQNDDMKKISGWAAILFAPSLIAAVYGMNFATMPELNWFYGYPAAILLMLTFAASLYVIFKRNRWM